MRTLWLDLRYGLRILMKNPGSTVIAVITLALGIGANTAIFSIMNALLWRPLPVTLPQQIVGFQRGDGRGEPCSYPDYIDYRDRNQVLDGVIASSVASLSFGNGERSDLVRGEVVSGNYFDVLGLKLTQGRSFLPEEDRTPGTHPVVVVSHDFWQKRFDSDPSLVGKQITINNRKFTVIGIAPRGFTGVMVPFPAEIWVPVMMQETAMPNMPGLLNDRHGNWLGVFGRLKHGISLEQAQASLETLNRQLEQAYPNPNLSSRNVSPEERAIRLGRPQGISLPHIRRRAIMATMLLTVIVGLVLLIACANVANLLLARAASRRKEIAVRMAIGASRWQIVKQLLTESVMLALLGGMGGIMLAHWITSLLMRLEPPLPPPWRFAPDLTLDYRVLGLTLILALVTAIISGLAPALVASRPDLVPTLKDENVTLGRVRKFSLRNTLVVAQVSLSLVLLISAGLFLRGLQRAQTIDVGFELRSGLVMSFDLGLQGYSEAQGQTFYQQLRDRINALPGVRSSSLISFPPLGFMDRETGFTIEGRAPSPNGPESAGFNVIAPVYFQTMGTSLLRGREFTERDSATSAGVVIVNETMARRYWPNEEALGKLIRTAGRNSRGLEIVGVVRDSKQNSLSEEPQAVMYVPLAQNYSPVMHLVVRTATEPGVAISSIRQQIVALDPNLPAQSIRTIDEHLSFALYPARMGAGMLMGFGLVGLLLAAIGLYGVMAFTVARRTQEIGIRVALGAQTGDVLRLVIKQGMILTLIGLLFGLLASLAVARLISGALYGVSATDPMTYIIVTVVLMSVALLACYLPARRATRVDPIVALRHE